MAGTSRTDAIHDAAVDLADAILLLHAIRGAKRALLSQPALPQDHDPFEEILFETGFYEGAPRSAWVPKLMKAIRRSEATPEGKADIIAAVDLMRSRAAELRRMDDYERKAISRRKKLIVRLDYLTLEARRQEWKSPSARLTKVM